MELSRLPIRQALARLSADYLKDAREAAGRLEADDDGEALHDLRVALRRLHSLLRSYGGELEGLVPKKLGRRVRRLARSTNAARDADVQLLWLRQQAGGVRPVLGPGYDWVVAQVTPAAAAAPAPLQQEVAALVEKFRRPLAKLERQDGPQYAAVAAEQAAPLCREVCQVLAAITGAHDVGGAHRARIQVKRLRYLLAPLRAAGPACEGATDLLRHLQDLLGSLHDRHVLAGLLRQAAARAAMAHGEGLFVRLQDGGRVSAAAWRPPQLAGLWWLAQRNEKAVGRLFGQLQTHFLAPLDPQVRQPLEQAVAELKRSGEEAVRLS